MPSAGPTEVLLLLTIFVAVPASLITMIAAAVRTHRRARTPHRPPMPRHHLSPSQLQQHVRTLIAADRRILAIKIVRDQTGLDLKSANRYVDDLHTARTPHPSGPFYGDATPPTHPSPTAPGHDTDGADLATRVRRLKAAGRNEQAVLLVGGETGMSEPDARRFVESLQD
ncbi:hypothetical protein ACQPYK_26035 [Streptosporangium sp. CA-135522]|uniref:hypothetical protein n=1 Tax=Streptosporangium sp. CA-135522 TaxID=3240072 RepID=UPI003D8B97CD